MTNEGLVYVFTGDGKGKTSAALGVVLRMLLLKRKVVWISWYKSIAWDISEKKLVETFKDNLEMYWIGKGFYIKKGKSAKVNQAKVFDYDTQEGHIKAAKEARDLALKILNKSMKSKVKLPLLVLDEINQTVSDGLLTLKDLKVIIEKRGSTNIVMTGRSFPAELLSEIDLLTEMKKIKHPFDSGTMAVKGLDF